MFFQIRYKRGILVSLILAISFSGAAQNSSDEFTVITINKNKQLKNNPGPLEQSDGGLIPLNTEDFAIKLTSCISGTYYPETKTKKRNLGLEIENNETKINIKKAGNRSVTVTVLIRASAIQSRGSGKDKFEWEKEEAYTVDLTDLAENNFHIKKKFVVRLEGGYVTEKSTGFVHIEGMLGGGHSLDFTKSIYLRSSDRYSRGDKQEKRYYISLFNNENGDWLISVSLGKGSSRLDTFDFTCSRN